VEVADDWEKPEEEDDDWDPDFDEFDVPGSGAKKATVKKGKKGKVEDDDDFKVDDDFKELGFDDGDDDFDDDEDDF
jgi:nucleolin